MTTETYTSHLFRSDKKIQIHFNSEVYAAAGVVNVKAPYKIVSPIPPLTSYFTPTRSCPPDSPLTSHPYPHPHAPVPPFTSHFTSIPTRPCPPIHLSFHIHTHTPLSPHSPLTSHPHPHAPVPPNPHLIYFIGV